MDPFDARMRFTQQLQHLSASTSSATKAANFALKYAEYSEDLHSCILEQLERNSMNNRANIMFFIPALCDAARSASEQSYPRMVARDILRIIDLVAPDDGSGSANIKVVRQVLQLLKDKQHLQPDAVKELEECIAGRDTTGGENEEEKHVNEGHRSKNERSTQSRDAPTLATKLDKRQVEQRIEEDRERHKKSREGRWAVQQANDDLAVDAQCSIMWNELEKLDEDDFVLIMEEAEDRTECLQFEKLWTDMPWSVA